jgi:hypothetical protein
MFSVVASQFGMRADWLLAGRYDDIAAGYRYPLPVFLGTRRMIVCSPDEAKAMLALQHSVHLGRGVRKLTPKVTALDLPQGDRFRVWVDWHEQADAPKDCRVSSALYYCSLAPTGLQIEMVNYTRLSMPEFKPHFAALALSA